MPFSTLSREIKLLTKMMEVRKISIQIHTCTRRRVFLFFSLWGSLICFRHEAATKGMPEAYPAPLLTGEYEYSVYLNVPSVKNVLSYYVHCKISIFLLL